MLSLAKKSHEGTGRKEPGRKGNTVRITYYYFPDSTPVEERISAYLAASGVKLDMTDRFDRCRYRTISEEVKDGRIAVSITVAKRLLRSIGGTAETHHIERDGTIFEVTPVRLVGNNSRHKYNKHL